MSHFSKSSWNEFDAPHFTACTVALHRQAGVVCHVLVCKHRLNNPASQHVLISCLFGFYMNWFGRHVWSNHQEMANSPSEDCILMEILARLIG